MGVYDKIKSILHQGDIQGIKAMSLYSNLKKVSVGASLNTDDGTKVMYPDIYIQILKEFHLKAEQSKLEGDLKEESSKKEALEALSQNIMF
jgi:hypothetical protein